jgi:D-alanyl-lipoteichoic acid acyltransferase DltB (MBOAT superfamily)
MATRNWGNPGLVISLMINMILIGLWHNLSWTFLVFGVLHGIFLSIDALSAKDRSKFFKRHPAWDRAGNWAGMLLTFHLVALAMVFVRAASLANASDVLARLFAPLPHTLLLMLQSKEGIYGLTGLALWAVLELVLRQNRFRFAATPVWGRWAFYYVVIGIIVKCGHNAEGFIYFKF